MSLRPSAAGIWSLCSGYVNMCSAYPDAPDESDTEVREEGLACHALAHSVANGIVPEVGSISANNVVQDDEMFDAVDMYLGVLSAWPGVSPVLEQPVDCSVIVDGMTGTPDAWAWNPTTRTLHVADLKFGYRFVEVWENPQLIIYAAAIIELLKIDPMTEQYASIEFTIVQPRSFHAEGPVRTWKIRMTDLRAHANWIRTRAEATLKPDALCTPNPGCIDCPARHACPTLQQAALTARHEGYASIPHDIGPAGVATELTWLKHAAKLLDARISGLEAQAEGMLRAGRVLPGWEMATRKGREYFKPDCEQSVINLGKLVGVDLIAPRKPISPAKARKLLQNPEILEPYIHTPNSGVSLSPINKFKAAKAFNKG